MCFSPDQAPPPGPPCAVPQEGMTAVYADTYAGSSDVACACHIAGQLQNHTFEFTMGQSRGYHAV